jgi:hypothetical protein
MADVIADGEYCTLTMQSNSLVCLQGTPTTQPDDSMQADDQGPQDVILNLGASSSSQEISPASDIPPPFLGSRDPSAAEEARPAQHTTAGSARAWLFSRSSLRSFHKAFSAERVVGVFRTVLSHVTSFWSREGEDERASTSEADGYPGCRIQPLEQLGSNLMELAAASKKDACVEAVARAIAEQKLGSYSVMLHLQDAVWALQREPKHHRVLVALLSCVPLLQLEELGVGKEELEEADKDCVR